MERKDFLKSTCKLCLLGAAGYLLPSMTGCASTVLSVYNTTIDNNSLKIPLKIFEESSFQIIKPQGWYYDIALQKQNDNTFSAILLQCTHQENQLNIATNGYSCSQHGSLFDKTGKVIKGPADIPLKKYNVVIDKDKIIIYL